jgi:hypothetical protein
MSSENPNDSTMQSQYCNKNNYKTADCREIAKCNHQKMTCFKAKDGPGSHPTTELVVSLIVNHEEHLLRALADTGASSIIILEAYTSAPFIKSDDSNTSTWNTIGGKFTTTKTGICL